MDIKNFSHQEKALILSGIFIFILIGGILFLGNEFKNIDKLGVKCLNSPLIYAENRMYEDKGEIYDCSCKLPEDVNPYAIVSYP